MKNRMPGFVGAHLADLVVENKTLILEHLNHPLFHARGRNIYGRPLNAIRIANLRQQISYRIGHHVASLPLPTRFSYSRNQAVAGHLAKTNAANAELAIDGSRPAAQSAAKSDADLVP